MSASAERRLTVVAPQGYPWAFNGPRTSRHRIKVRPFAPLNRVRSSLDGITVFSPLDTLGADLIHGFNRVPMNGKPFVLGFESHLPRTWGLEGSAYERLLYANLRSPRCRRLVAISNYAGNNFRIALAASRLPSEARETLLAKLEMRYPNLVVPAAPAQKPDLAGGLVATFVGSHFARKGGCVVVRMAELAASRKIPITFNIVSGLQMGGGIWTDPSRDGFYERYRKLLDQPNVNYSPALPNAEVRALLASSHVSLLPTFADTFGFSVLEAMASGTPTLATAQSALPEAITDGIDGMLLAPARIPGQNGWIWRYDRRGEADFERHFADQVERLADAGLARLAQLLDDPAGYAAMAAAAHGRALRQFNADGAGAYWDQLYVDALEGRPGKTHHNVSEPPLRHTLIDTGKLRP